MTRFCICIVVMFVGLNSSVAVVRGDVIVASNFPDSFQYSGYRADIGYWSDVNNHPTNTADSQRFVPTQTGMLSTLTVYAQGNTGGEPLRVSLRNDQAGEPGSLLAELSFSDFPGSYFPPSEPTVLDVSAMGIQLEAGTAYHAVFRTDTALYHDYYYSLHVLDPHPGSFGHGHCWSPDGAVNWWPPSSREIAMQLAISDPAMISFETAPTLDAKADFSYGGSVVVDGESAVNVQQVDFADVDRRGVLEFDLGQIPDQARITSATLELDIVNLTSSGGVYPMLDLHGYAGNGTLEIADGQVPPNLIGQSGPIPDLGLISIDLDTHYTQSLLSTTDYLGLLVLNDENHKQAAFVTSEGAIPDTRYAPKLRIEIGEPVVEQWAPPAGGDGLYGEPSNWTGGVPNGVDAVANFLEKITTDSEVTVDVPVTLGTVDFKEEENSYTIVGPETVTFETTGGVDAQIAIEQGEHTISAPLAFAATLPGLTVATEESTRLTVNLGGASVITTDLTKTGAGTWVIEGGLLLLGEIDAAGGTLQLDTNLLGLPGGNVSIADGATLKTSGDVDRRVLGVSGATLEATGPTEIGLLGEADGWAYVGALEVGPHMVGLKDADEAPLYGAHMAGGTISSFNGIRLLPINTADGLNSRLYGFGTVNGNVVAGIEGDPTPAVVVADPGETIELTGVVQTGNSTFVNNVVITGTERLGFSPAVGMKLGGAPIGPDAVVEVYGTAGADFESEIPDALAPPVADPVSGYGQFYVAGGQSLVSGKITLSTGGSDYVSRGGDTFDLIVTGQAWLMDFTQFPPQNVLLPEGSVNIDPGFIVDTSGIPLASPGLFWQEFRSEQGLTLKIVPEPGTLVLLITGGLGLLAFAGRKRGWR